ncbi:hypothetical protein [Xanthomonas vasicola]|uniref:hypothetical protein n=2 Tax=Xanthomonas vasicola TaxID=56459 RepID=UPI0001CC0B78|nr:hypothetical protein [Xanthomonas vasicola]KFA17999.1 hypothetical protein KWS_0125555 [Xanthomonas vasicola pv. musacearum NCPPB 4384]AZR30978.1 hypothetical protein KWO_010980 [Xanthomonas vasicola pv. musacearum NCPPB 4379]KFA05571.1 hypothetical protein KWQ_0119570 [Xanthomonas vasicola pv. musacearum NCPPB 4380]KFA18766.1 hypothetical protein KWU_0118580 [Xanthomonas vasicola pv. musacearum NCPPB 4394]MBV6744448.1 hypothetical protein [Xanthomonas vasicola pv. musacearum NCPPB 2251]
MNKNISTVVTKAKSAVSNAKTAAIVGSTALMAMPGFAFASGGGGDFDGTAIVGKVVTYTAIGVTILAAFALGRWTLRALGLIGGK